MKECDKLEATTRQSKREEEKNLITKNKPQIYFYVFWQVFAILSPLNVVLSTVRNMLFDGFSN